MSSNAAALAFVVAIAGLFLLNRDRKVHTTAALWIPFIWLMIACSRNVSEWLQLNITIDAADRYLEGSPVDRNILAVIMAAGTVVLFRRKERTLAILKANTAIVVYFLYCGASVFWSDYSLVAGKRWFRSLGDVIMVLVVLTEPSWRAAFTRVLTRVGFLLLPISVLLIKYFPYWGRSYGEDGTVYWTGVAAGKNSLGMICLIYGLVSVWCFLVAYRGPRDAFRTSRMLAQGALTIAAVWLLWVVNSKTSLACFALASTLMIATFLIRATRKPAPLFALVATIVSAAGAVLFLGVGKGALEAMGRNATLTGRTDIWRVVLQFADNPLFGAGYESFWLGKRLDEIARALNVALLNQAHNGYLEVYLSLGWVGVTLLLVLIVTGYRKIAAGFRQDPDMSSLKIAFFVLVVIYNFTEGVFKTMSPVWLAFLLATMVVPLRMTPSRRQKSASEDSIADGTPDEARQLSPVAVKPRKISEPTPYPVRK